MHIVEEDRSVSRPSAFKKMNYSNCPLKKRPVHAFYRDDYPTQSDVSDDNSEPENLSTKPEDIAKSKPTLVSPTVVIPIKKEPERPEPIIHHFMSKPLEPLNLNTQQFPAYHYPYYPYNDIYRPVPSYPSEKSAFVQIAQPKPLYVMPYPPPVQESSVSPTSSTSSLSSYNASSPYNANYLVEDLSSPSSVGSPSSPRKRKEPSSTSRYQCNFCNKCYSTFSGLSKHQQFHCSANEDSKAQKTFSCKHCDKVYVSLGALKMHIRTHTLPCKCKLCGKAFSRPWLLQGHIRTHTGEKPFTCPHCNRAFADRSNLRAHLQTHSDVKKYSCLTCSKTFSRMSLLTKHCEGGCPGSSQTEEIYKLPLSV